MVLWLTDADILLYFATPSHNNYTYKSASKNHPHNSGDNIRNVEQIII